MCKEKGNMVKLKKSISTPYRFWSKNEKFLYVEDTDKGIVLRDEIGNRIVIPFEEVDDYI